MGAPTCTDAEFIAAWNRHTGYVPGIQAELKLSARGILGRRATIEKRHGMVLKAGKFRPDSSRTREHVDKIGHRITLTVKDGMVVAFGDAHWWPGDDSIAHKALLQFIKEHKPATIVCMGDAFDGARISRHPPTGWARMPDVAEELEYCQQMMNEVEEVAPPKAKLIWVFGNHDSRFSGRLAQTAPEYVRVFGADLPDHFPAWNFAWSTEINGNVMLKHRHHQSIHAAYQNTMKGGRTIVTAHTHRLQATSYSDYNGLRWGIETGTISKFGPDVDKFTYGEDQPFNWCQGFAVLTFVRGNLLEPEFCRVIEKVPYFRGKPV